MTARNGWRMLVISAIATEDQIYQIGPDPCSVHHRRAGDVLLPDREPQAVLDEMRRAMGTMNFAAQYQQNPVPPEGNIIKRDWVKLYEEEPEFSMLVATWDLASTVTQQSSYSVGQLWGVAGANRYLLDLVRVRMEPPELRRRLIRAIEDWQPNATVVEDTELARALVTEIVRTTDHRPILQTPRLEKTARLEAQAPQFEAGQVYLPRNASWLPKYLSELLAFPNGRHDDQVDATSLALYYITARTARQRPLVRRDIHRRNIVNRR